jgi:hypothetical protein
MATIILAGSHDRRGEDMPIGYLTDIMPDFRGQPFYNSYFTTTGWTLRSIDGGRAC